MITFFNAGAGVTFPLFAWGAARVAVPPQINVISTMLFGAAIVLMFPIILWQRRKAVTA